MFSEFSKFIIYAVRPHAADDMGKRTNTSKSSFQQQCVLSSKINNQRLFFSADGYYS
jgi:hypothetical protein